VPEIIESDGSIFESGCAALVNPVDAVTGAQGKGLALAFKQRWPERCAAYRDMCLRGVTRAGGVEVSYGQEDPVILFAATKHHWRERSTIKYVRLCLAEIVRIVNDDGIPSIALPALGCGEGGLPWDEIRPRTIYAAQQMRCERVVIYGPK
jgi:O-acetyl-ADP-ribose deacetylase (regulator of RNase III)